MKLIIITISIIISLNAQANTNKVSLTTSNTQEQSAINAATPNQIKELVECIIDQDETSIDETSCVNDILGDIHN